jgi:hypothetical protein
MNFIRRRQKTPWLIKPGDEWRGEPDEAPSVVTGRRRVLGFGYDEFRAIRRL